MKSLLRVFPIWAALFLTIIMLVLVGIGEAKRHYYLFRIDTAMLQSESLLGIIQRDLDTGASLKSFSGLAQMAKSLNESDATILGISIKSDDGSAVVDEGVSASSLDKESFEKSKLEFHNEKYKVFESETHVRLDREVVTRFGKAGNFTMVLDKAAYTRDLEHGRDIMALSAAGLALLLYALMVFSVARMGQRRILMKRFIQVCYLVVFLAVSVVISVQTLQLYTKAVTNKTTALGNFLAQRLSLVPKSHLSFVDISGISPLLDSFRTEHPEICSIAILEEDKVRYSSIANTKDLSESSMIPETIKIAAEDTNGDGTADTELQLCVKVPRSVIWNAVLNGSVNMLVLLISCGLLANIILEAGVMQLSLALNRARKEETVHIMPELLKEQAMGAMQTSYLVMGLINALTLPFLAPVIQEIADGKPTSLPFTAFFLCFAIFMIPAGGLAERGHTKALLIFGVVMETLGCLLVAAMPTLVGTTIGRGLSGLGQGVFLIGFQSFVVSVTPASERTQGQSIKVIIRYAVLVAGSAIGSLMYVYLDFIPVFIISGLLGVAMLLYIAVNLPDPNNPAFQNKSATMILEKRPETEKKSVFGLGSAFKALMDAEFIKTLLLSGIPSKVAVAGVAMFSFPLLLTEKGIASESIGRYLMLYYVACMIVSHWIAKYADRSGKTKSLLVWSAFVGGASFVLLGGMTCGVINLPAGSETLSIILLGLSVVLGGIANGMNAAPVVTHIGKTEVSKAEGRKTMMAVYSFFERMGHVIGPALLVYGSMMAGSMGMAILYFGVISIILGLAFMITSRIK